MELKTIQTNSSWGTGAGDINENFSRTGVEIEKLKNSTVRFKGYYAAPAELAAAVPSPLAGDSAWVGTPYPGVIYKCATNGVWTSTPKVPQTPSIDLNNWNKTDW